jgi:hypothetical protein
VAKIFWPYVSPTLTFSNSTLSPKKSKLIKTLKGSSHEENWLQEFEHRSYQWTTVIPAFLR